LTNNRGIDGLDVCNTAATAAVCDTIILYALIVIIYDCYNIYWENYYCYSIIIIVICLLTSTIAVVQYDMEMRQLGICIKTYTYLRITIVIYYVYAIRSEFEPRSKRPIIRVRVINLDRNLKSHIATFWTISVHNNSPSTPLHRQPYNIKGISRKIQCN